MSDQDNDWYRWSGSRLLLRLQLQPRSSRNEFGEIHNGRRKLRITAPPVDGKANQQLVSFLAKQFRISRSAVQIKSGDNSRLKSVILDNPEHIPPVLGIIRTGPR